MKDYIEKIRLAEERGLLAFMEEAFNAPAITLISFQDQENKDRFWFDSISGFPPLSPVGERLYALTQKSLADSVSRSVRSRFTSVTIPISMHTPF